MFKKLSIKTTFTLIFVTIFATLLVLLFLLNRFFLQDYYQFQKINQIGIAYSTIDKAIALADDNGSTIFELINDESEKTTEESPTIAIFRTLNERSNIDIVLISRDRKSLAATSRDASWLAMKLNVYMNYLQITGSLSVPETGLSTDGGDDARIPDDQRPEDLRENPADVIPEDISEGSEVLAEVNDRVKLIERNDNYFIQLVLDSRSNTSHLECMGVFSDGDTFFLMTTPIESIEEGVSITTKFLYITGIILLIAGSLVVYFAVSRCTAPINSLARLSDKIANLDFTEKYEGNSLNELGVLGNSMNSMSEKLETSIRELSEANAKLQADIEEKVRMDEARKEFIADVSHELKTPIALIEGYAEGLVEGLAEDKDSRDYYCNVIMDEAAKMNKLVRQLTSLMSYEFGSNAPERKDFNLCELISSVTDSMKLRFEEKEAILTLELPDQAMVNADEFKIEEVYTNYINNAFNHLDFDRNIKVRLIKEDGNVTVYVYNDGRPIPDDSIDRVWDKFYKADKARTRSYGGSGIGLSIVKAIMESHGGTYGVENRENGVEFHFTLKEVESNSSAPGEC